MKSKRIIIFKNLRYINIFFFNKGKYVVSLNNSFILGFMKHGLILNISNFLRYLRIVISFLSKLSNNSFSYLFFNNFDCFIKLKPKGLILLNLSSVNRLQTLIFSLNRSSVLISLGKPCSKLVLNFKYNNFYMVGMVDSYYFTNLFDMPIHISNIDAFYPNFFFTLYFYRQLSLIE